MESPSEAERKRKLACDSCRKKKMKCEWDDENVCNRCKERRINCIPHPVQAKRKERKPNTYLASLEDRLKRMEEAIRKPSAASTPSPRPSAELSHQSIPDRLSGLKIHDDGTTMFVASFSGFSIISPVGMKWISEVTKSDDFEKVVAKIPSWSDLTASSQPDVWAHLKESDRQPLPSVGRANAHFDSFFHEGFNTLFPVFDEMQIRERFARQYPVTPEEDYAWYACLNMIFSISELVHGKIGSPMPNTDGSPSPNRVPPRHTDFLQSSCWKWFQNAASTFNHLQFLDGSLPAVQAMIAMCFILQTIPNPHPSLVVSGTALRLAQTIGLHRYLPHLKLPPKEVELRRNIFWIGLVIERQIAVRMGAPSVIHDDDIGLDLPKEVGHKPTDNYLRYMSQMALIQGKIYSSLYSAKSLSKSRIERLRSVGLLDEEVEYWRDQLHPSVRPENDCPMTEESFFPTIMMQFAYFNSLTMIHRVSGLNGGPWTEKYDDSISKTLQDSDVNPRVLSGGSICADAARNAIRLLDKCSPLIGLIDLNMVRVISYYPLTASLTIFANVLHKPRDPQALEDIELMKSVTNFLRGYLDEDDAPSVFLVGFFGEIYRLAERFVQKSQREARLEPAREVVSDEQVDVKIPTRPAEQNQIERSMNQFQQQSTIGQNPFSSSQYKFSPSGDVESSYAESPYMAAPSPFDGQTPLGFENSQNFQTMATDPMALLDERYHNPPNPSNMNFNSDWMNGNDMMMQPELFLPHDGSWFLPWDIQNQPSNFSPMDPNPDHAMQ